jgi:hypothetical protein
MGAYGDKLQSRISDRVRHVKIREGYCVICGQRGKLTQDHVPPQGAITISKVEQHHITEVIGLGHQKFPGVPSPNGSKFKTVCAKCNNEIIGSCDSEVAKLHSKVIEDVSRYFSAHEVSLPYVSRDFDAINYCRAMIGHILSATSIDECLYEPEPTSYFDPLKRFVLGDDEAINDTHDIFTWFYPWERHVSAKLLGFYNQGENAMLSLLAFYPIAFMVTEKGKGTAPAQANQMQLSDKRFNMSLRLENIAYSKFPFIELKGDQLFMLTDYQCVTSKPIK